MKLALLRALLVFGVFGLYAALAPRQYESESKVRLGDGRTVALRFRDANPERAQAGANELAKKALARPITGTGAPDRRGTEADEALAKFVAEHAEPPSLAPASSVPKQQRDTERVRLEIERNRIQAELEHSRAAPPHGDNPFEDQAPEGGTRQLRLRLDEVNRLLRQRAAAAEQADAPPPVDNSVATTFLRLVDDAVRAAPPPPPVAQAPAVLEEARLPLMPIEPRISLLFALGGVAGLLSGLLPLLFRGPRPLPGMDEPELELAGYGALPRSLPPGPMHSPAPVPSPMPSPLPPAMLAPTHAPARRASSAPPGSAGPGELVAYPLPWNAPPPPSEALSTLLAQLRSLATQDCFVVAVSSSAQAADARSRVVARLAAACTRADELLALVLDADLSRPMLHRVLGSDIPAETELTRQLEGRLEGTSTPWSVLELAPSLHALLAEQRAPDLTLSHHFEACIKGLRPFYDIIILHAPPLTEVPQCKAINDLVDGLILVRRPGEGDSDGSPTPPFTAKRFATNIPAAWADDSR